MEKYTVAKPFQDMTGFKAVGEFIELDDGRAAKLRARGLIGGIHKEPESEPEQKQTIEELEELKKIYPESKAIEKKVAAKKVK